MGWQRMAHFVGSEGEMGDGRGETRHHALGRVYEVLALLGIASPGHLIHKPPEDIPVVYTTLILQSEYEEIWKKLYAAEKAMSILTQQVAQWVVKKIV